MAAIPFDDLEGAAGKREQWIRYLEEERAQPAPLAACGFGGVRRDADRHAIDALEASEIMPCAVDGQAREVGESRKCRGLAGADENLIVAPDEAHRVGGKLRRRGKGRLEAGRGVHPHARGTASAQEALICRSR